jgi:hypothetical protein
MCFGNHPFIEVDEELRLLIPRPTKEEIAQLEANIVADGEIKEPVTVWGNVLVDGYTRLEIARRLKMPFHLKRREFRDNDEAKAWMLRNQLGRRNLAPDQMSLIRAELYRLAKDDHGGDRKSSGKSYHLKEKACETVAKETGVSEKTVRNDAKYADAVKKLTPEVREAVVNHDVKANRKAVKELAEKPPEEQKAVVAKVKAGEAKTVQEAIKPKAKNGKPIGWQGDKLAEGHYGKLVRSVDEKAAAVGKGKHHKLCLECLSQFLGHWNEWKAAKA